MSHADLEAVGGAGEPDVLREGCVAVSVVDTVGVAAGAVAMHGFVDADVEDVVVACVLEAGTCGDGVTGSTEAVVADGE